MTPPEPRAAYAAAASAWRDYCNAEGRQATLDGLHLGGKPVTVLLMALLAEPRPFADRFTGELLMDVLGGLRAFVTHLEADAAERSKSGAWLHGYDIESLSRRLDAVLALRACERAPGRILNGTPEYAAAAAAWRDYCAVSGAKPQGKVEPPSNAITVLLLLALAEPPRAALPLTGDMIADALGALRAFVWHLDADAREGGGGGAYLHGYAVDSLARRLDVILTLLTLEYNLPHGSDEEDDCGSAC